MLKTLQIRSVLRGLAAYGVLISYTAGLYSGQRLRVWPEWGIPVNMTFGAALAYLRHPEACDRQERKDEKR